MNLVDPEKLQIKVDEAERVSALLLQPAGARACFVFAHGAEAGVTHEFMERVASASIITASQLC
jgi:uncharacterized protein